MCFSQADAQWFKEPAFVKAYGNFFKQNRRCEVLKNTGKLESYIAAEGCIEKNTNASLTKVFPDRRYIDILNKRMIGDAVQADNLGLDAATVLLGNEASIQMTMVDMEHSIHPNSTLKYSDMRYYNAIMSRMASFRQQQAQQQVQPQQPVNGSHR